MSYIKRKLNDDKGISILFAMVLLLVTAMVCTVIVSASVSSAKRTNSRIAAVQETTLMDSATLYIKENILESCKNGIELSCDKDNNCVISSSVSGTFNKEIEELSLAYINKSDTCMFDKANDKSDKSFEIVTSYNDNENVIEVQYGYCYKNASDDVAMAIFKLTCNESKMYVIFNIDRSGNNVSWSWNRASGNGI